VAVGVFIYRRSVADGVEVMCALISATQDLFSQDVGVVFLTWIVEATELLP